jgi:hypothetical protein
VEKCEWSGEERVEAQQVNNSSMSIVYRVFTLSCLLSPVSSVLHGLNMPFWCLIRNACRILCRYINNRICLRSIISKRGRFGPLPGLALHSPRIGASQLAPMKAWICERDVTCHFLIPDQKEIRDGSKGTWPGHERWYLITT